MRNEAAITDYNRLDNSDGQQEPELAEQAFSEIETLARPVLDKISARQALTPRERIALATFLQLQYQRTPRMRENMRFVTSAGCAAVGSDEVVRSRACQGLPGK